MVLNILSSKRKQSSLCARPCALRTFGIYIALIVICFSGQRAHAQVRTALSNSTALYARVVRLTHNADTTKNGTLVATVVAFPGGVGEIDVYGSSDGSSFTQIGTIHDADFPGGLCCGTLFELSQAVGAVPAGTLLWAGSVGQSSTTKPMQLKIYQSADRGATWSYLSNSATASGIVSAVGGLWEPQFEIAGDGALVCFWSDETQAGHSQVLRQIRSYDGFTWQGATNTVASTIVADRPGMAVVTQLPTGTYLMSYEICGTPSCAAFTRTSVDGWNWGNVTSYGNKVVTQSGQWLEHAPFNAWATSAASPNGTILMIGQMMYDAAGVVSSGNGVTIFTNHSPDGSGTWGAMPAPVRVPTAYNNYCPNYSSPLLPSLDGTSVLELASDYVGTVCTMFYGTGPIQAGTATATVTVKAPTTSVTSYPIQVTVTMAGTGSLAVPIGNVTLATGSYSATQALVNGAATFSIAGPLTAGTDTLTATFTGDSNYLSATGTTTVNVVAPGITAAANALTLSAGATTSNSTTITITPTGGFTGSVTLVASILTSPVGATALPTFSFSPSNSVAITGTSPATASLAVSTTATTSALIQAPAPFKHSRPEAPIAYAGLVLFAVFGRMRWLAAKLPNGCWLVVVLGISLAGMVGCSAGTKSSNTVHGTTPGTYVIQIVGTSGSVTATTQFSLTVQ